MGGVHDDGDPYAPNPEGTAMPDDSRWGAWDPAAVKFVGGDDLFETKSVELIASGFRWTEGPTWVPAMSALLFSDTIDARIYCWRGRGGGEPGGVELLFTESGGYDGRNVPNFDELFEPGSNGMALHADHLYVNQHPTRRVVRIPLTELKPGAPFHESKFEVLADKSPEGRPLNAPNDVVVAGNGDVFFTDPIYGFLKKQPREKGFAFLNAESAEHPDQPYLDECCEKEGAGYKGVYRVRDGTIELVTRELERPNGLAFSADGSCLWVANSDKETPSWTAFAMSDTLPLEKTAVLDPETLGDESIRASIAGPGLSDGFKLDARGRIWSTVPGGLIVIDPERKAVLAKVAFGTNMSNLQFGEGGDVFVTGLGHLWRLQRKV